MQKPIVTAAVLISLCASLTLGAEKKIILRREPHRMRVGVTEFLSTARCTSRAGGEDAAGEFPSLRPRRSSLDNINAVLKEAAMTLGGHREQVYITDAALFDP